MAAVTPLVATSSTTSFSNNSYNNNPRGDRASDFHQEREAYNLNRNTTPHRPHIFSGFSQDEISHLTACARILRIGRGEFIYMPGERADFVYILRQGRVKLSVLSESGKEIAIDIIEPGEIFGEFALVDESVRSNMTQALDNVIIWAFYKNDFAHLLTQAKLSMNYIRLVGDRRRRMEKKLSDLLSKDVSARVCELLQEFLATPSEIDKVARGYLVPLTHQDVASLIGASRQTTTSVLNQLERSGIIELGRGWIRVKRPTCLQTYAGLTLAIGLQIFSHLCHLADIFYLYFLA